MFPLFLLLIHVASYGVAYGTLDIGPARVDVDVFMSLDHQTSSTLSATSFTTTTTTGPVADATSEYTESPRSPLHPFSKATSYVASAWNELESALHDSGTSTSITSGFESLETSSTATTTTTPAADAPTRYPESPQSPLHPYSRATSYVASAWNELNSALHDSETSTSSFARLATGPAADETTCSEAPTVHSPQSSMTSLPQYSNSASLKSTEACDGSATARPSLFASSTGPASCSSYPSGLSDANGTGTWVWPPIISTWPSSSTHSGNSNHSSPPIVQSGRAGGKPTIIVWACWVVGASILAGEVRGML